MKKLVDTSNLLKPRHDVKRNAKRHSSLIENADGLKPAHMPYKKAKTNFKHYVEQYLDDIDAWYEEA
jgi:hypothetical protein